MVGLRTDVGPTGALFLRDRWRDVLILCALVFAGRLVVSLWGLRPQSAAPSPRRAEMLRQAGGPSRR
jgi:hypothetical protein